MNILWSLFVIFFLWSAAVDSRTGTNIVDVSPNEAVESSDSKVETIETFDVPTSVTDSQRDKRVVITLAAAASVATIASAIFGGASFIYGVVNGQQKLRELRAIRAQVEALNRKVDEIQRDINSLQLGQQWIQLVSQYSRYTQRIDYFRGQLNQMQVQSNGKIGSDWQSSNFRQQVLTRGVVASECLHQMHNMIMGAGVFNGQSVVEVFRQRAPSTNKQTQRWHVQSYINQLVGLEIAGYTAWFTALNMNRQEAEVARLQSVMNSRLKQQQNIFNQVLGRSNDVFANNWGSSSWKTSSRKTKWDQTWVPGNIRTGPMRPLKGCQFYKKSSSSDRIGIRCIAYNLRSPKAGPNHPNVIGTVSVNADTSVTSAQHIYSPKDVSTEWAMVPDPNNWMVCGVRFTGQSNKILGIAIMACTKDLRHRREVHPRSGAKYRREHYVDTEMVAPTLNGWITGVRLYKKGNRVAFQFKTSYQ